MKMRGEACKVYGLEQRIALHWFDPDRSREVQFKIRPAGNQLTNMPNHLICDRRGAVWLGTQGRPGRLVNGNVTIVQTAAGLPETNPAPSFLIAEDGCGSDCGTMGVSVTKDPNAENPQFANYSTANGSRQRHRLVRH